uniref:Long intergenic non-protein coding RNA 2693 n=1 Tax=Nomascus leucogenys TaxID=61853 RepID=G1RSV6_NOMLE
MGEKSLRKGPAPRHADGKLGRTCDHPYAPWGFTPASRAPTAWAGASFPEPQRAGGPPTRPLRLRDHLGHFSILMMSCTSWLQASQAPGLCRDKQSSRISVPHLSGAPILLPDLEGTQLSNFQGKKDKRSTPEEEGRSAPEKIIQSLKLCPGGHRPASLSSSCPAGCRLSFNLPPGMLLSVQKCCTPSSLKTC